MGCTQPAPKPRRNEDERLPQTTEKMNEGPAPSSAIKKYTP